MKKIFLAMIVLTTLAGCQTFEGFTRDVEAGTRAVT